MYDQITTGFVDQFKTNLTFLLQQMGTRLRSTVTEDSYTGQGGAVVEQIGAVEAREVTTRHADSPLIETPHARRWVYPTDFDWGDLIDDVDKLRRIVDPTSAYAVNGANSLGRKLDDQVITAATADAKTGQSGSDTTPFATSTQTVDASFGGSADHGLTVAKLIEMKRILASNEVDLDNEDLTFVYSSHQEANLLNDIRVTSRDYNGGVPVLNKKGGIDSFLGFQFKRSERLGYESATTNRLCLAYAKTGMHYGSWSDIRVRIAERADKRFSAYVYAAMTGGATRLEEGKVGVVQCNES